MLNKDWRKSPENAAEGEDKLKDLDSIIKQMFSPEFVEYVRRSPRRTMTLADLADEWRKWPRKYAKKIVNSRAQRGIIVDL